MTMDASLPALLSRGLQALQVDCSTEAQEKLLAYVQLLAKWNRVYNLTAVRDPQEMVTRHVLDSLTLLPYLDGQRVLDVGSGGGLPGIPLAIVCPEREFVLLDSINKKTRFMQQTVNELGLAKVQVVHLRVEAYQPAALFDVVVSRAFASIADMLTASGHLCASGGVILAMKGVDPAAELIDIPQGYTVDGVHRLEVPGLDEARHVVCLRPGENSTGKNRA